MIKGIIFDLDGTTLNTLDDLHDSVNAALKEYGFPPRSKDEVRMGVGNGFRRLIDAIVPPGTDEQTRLELGDRYKEIYSLNCANKTRPYRGMPELLKQLQEKGVALAVNSNKSDENTNKLITKNYPGINFTAIYGAKEGIPHKPDPTSALLIAREMGLNSDEIAYVGDSDVDIRTALNAGFKAIGCLWGFRDYGVLKNAGAQLIVAEPEEILNYVETAE